MTRFNLTSLGFVTLLLLGLLCNARPVVEKRELGAQEVFDERSDSTLSTRGEPIADVAHNHRRSLEGMVDWLEPRMPPPPAPKPKRVKSVASKAKARQSRKDRGIKNKTQARKARKAKGISIKDLPKPKAGTGRNGLTKGADCISGKKNKCGPGGGKSLADAKKAKQRPAGPPMSAKKQKKIADRKENRQMGMKIKHQNFVKDQNKGVSNQRDQKWKIDPVTGTAQRAKTNAATKATLKAGTAEARKAHYKEGPSTAAKNQRLAESALIGGKDPKREQYKTAKVAYGASIKTKTFPDRKATFKTPKDGVYKGKDVRQALFNAHLHDQPGKKVGHTADGKVEKADKFKHPKTFNNQPNVGHGGKEPLPSMSGKGREYGMMRDHALGYKGLSPNPTATRLITKENAKGVHEFAGVISHPMPEPGNPKADNDHVQVHAT
jgi:hypothetical protein